MNVFRAETPPLFRWRSDVLFTEPLMVSSAMGPGTLQTLPAQKNAIRFQPQDAGFATLHRGAERANGAGSARAALRITPARESDQLQAQIHRKFGPGIVLAPNPGPQRPRPIPVNVSMLSGAVTLEALGIADQTSRVAQRGERVFFGDERSAVIRSHTQNSESQRIHMARQILALGATRVGQEAVRQIATARQPTLFHVLDERKGDAIAKRVLSLGGREFVLTERQLREHSRKLGYADYGPRHIGINERTHSLLEREFVFGALRDPQDLIYENTLLLHEINHINVVDKTPEKEFNFFSSNHRQIQRIDAYFLRSNGFSGNLAAFKAHQGRVYDQSPALEQYSRAFLYHQLNGLVDQVTQRPADHDQIILAHLRDQAALGVDIERYVNWLLPELDKRLAPQPQP